MGPESVRDRPTLFGFNVMVCALLLYHDRCFSAVFPMELRILSQCAELHTQTRPGKLCKAVKVLISPLPNSLWVMTFLSSLCFRMFA